MWHIFIRGEKIAEITAEELNVERNKIYTLADLNRAILSAYEDMLNSIDYEGYIDRVSAAIAEYNDTSVKALLSKIRLNRKYLPIYLYNMETAEERELRFKRLIYLTYPKTAIASIYIYALLDYIICHNRFS